MSNGTRIARAIVNCAKNLSSDTSDIISGVVTSVSPLRVKVDKLELTETFLIKGALVTEKRIQIGGEEILLWRDLQVGDNVYLLRVSGGQKFFILQRKEGA